MTERPFLNDFYIRLERYEKILLTYLPLNSKEENSNKIMKFGDISDLFVFPGNPVDMKAEDLFRLGLEIV